MNKHNPQVESFFKDAPSEKWANCKVPGKRYGQLTTSISEPGNNVLKGARQKAITDLAEHTRLKVTKWYNKRRAGCQAWITDLTPYALEQITNACERSRHLIVHSVDAWILQVNSGQYQDAVDLEKRTCSSGEFQDMGFHCDHAMAAIDSRSGDCRLYV